LSAQHAKPFSRVGAASGTTVSVAQGLACLHKAVKGAEFYPQGHPHRTDALQRAFEMLQALLRHRPLLFNVDRRGFTLLGERVEGGPIVLQLAHECVIRRIASIAFLQDLLLYDLGALVGVLSSDPHNSEAAGPQLAAGGRTVYLNERDVSAILAKRGAAGADQVAGAAAEKAAPAASAQAPAPAGSSGSPAVPELLQLLAQERVDARYQELGRELLNALRSDPQLATVLAALEELHRQGQEGQRSLPQREYAAFSFGRLAEAATDMLLGALESKACPDRERIHRVLAAVGGKAAYPIIERICHAKGLYERKALASALIALGPPALAPLLATLKDKRWYVVRNMVAILGELRNPDTVADLKRPLQHADERVRKESIRALAKIGGEAAEAALIPLLQEPDQGMVRAAAAALGRLRSRQAVPSMVKLLERRDLLLKELALKKDLLAALAAIGDYAVTRRLLKVLESRGWLVPRKYLELKLAAAAALGALGDRAALPVLTRLAAGKGALAGACRQAVDALEKSPPKTG
jgi:HEAT repeat protein